MVYFPADFRGEGAEMFRIKKDQYNTVQLLPDFKSADPAGSRQKAAPAPLSTEYMEAGRRRRNRALLVLLAVAVILAAVVAFHLLAGRSAALTPEEYETAFREGEYDLCAEAVDAIKDGDDEAYREAVRNVVQGEAAVVYDQYCSGELESGDALGKLQEMDRASAGWFGEELGVYTESITAINSIYESLYTVPELMANGQFGEACGILSDAETRGSEYGANPAWLMGPLINENLAGLKYYLFNEYTSQVRKGTDGYRYIENTANFILKYADDRDLTNYLSTLTLIRDGKESASYGADIARTIADRSLKAWNDARTETSPPA